MKRFEPNFPDLLIGLDLETLEKSRACVFAVDKNLCLSYFNPAWYVFASENRGQPVISGNFPLGTPVLDAISGDLKEFYRKNLQQVFDKGEVWHHEYECSSPDSFRVFAQSVYPLKNSEGLVFVNQLRIERPISDEGRRIGKPDVQTYLQDSGYINQCSNCRCVQRVDENEVWDWVTDWVESSPHETSHTICPVCFDYYWKYGMIRYKGREDTDE